VSGGARLSLWQAAFVVARRDFTAILMSRAFLFFLLGPLFPVLIGALAGGIGARVQEEAGPPQIGLAMRASDVAAMLAAHERLAGRIPGTMPEMIALARLKEGEDFDAGSALANGKDRLAGVVTGSLSQPVLTTTAGQSRRWSGQIALIAEDAARVAPSAYPHVETVVVAASGASESRARLGTAMAAQMVLFLLTMLLAGMVLSNLVEEKANKIIEILAAAIPMDAVFLGKLFAMLAVSMVGIGVWVAVLGGFVLLAAPSGMLGAALGGLTEPGVGWPLFLLLGIAYFSMGYLLVGSIFLAIGSLATTVREVQTLSMPVTMMQVLLFFFASYALSRMGEPMEWAAIAFPLSSPFAMLARAAVDDTIWVHAAALAWQMLWVAVSIRLGAMLFRKRVMKSGAAPARRRAGGLRQLLFRNSSNRTA